MGLPAKIVAELKPWDTLNVYPIGPCSKSIRPQQRVGELSSRIILISPA